MAGEMLFGAKTWGGGTWAREKYRSWPAHQPGTWDAGRWGRMFWGRRRTRVG
jgi:hypothetical protein